MLTTLVALVMVVALSAYVVFGGADFGGGMLEVTLPTRALRKRLELTLAPVWEANHVWLMARVVGLFVGFPRFNAIGFTRLFYPISLALFAILIRGTFFTLRKYDPQPGPALSRAYSMLFRLSSFMAPLCFGFVISGLLSVHPGGFDEPPVGYSAFVVYWSPSFNWFGLLVGIFICCLFTYLAAIFFWGELTKPEEQSLVWTRAKLFFAATFLSGAMVLLTGAITGRVPVDDAFAPLQVLAQVVALAATFVVLLAHRRNHRWMMRWGGGAQVLAILLGWFQAQGRTFLRFEQGPLLLDDCSAPPITQIWLLIGIAVVLALVVPLLVFLYRVFDRAQKAEG
ncbi:MAG: cytochrome d ubiquinol oxidase subunit II [Polyangiaceae bacterium]|nr:cytochrome d ubiquinol oxidase subunit II [Polyangiaceae bacterium]